MRQRAVTPVLLLDIASTFDLEKFSKSDYKILGIAEKFIRDFISKNPSGHIIFLADVNNATMSSTTPEGVKKFREVLQNYLSAEPSLMLTVLNESTYEKTLSRVKALFLHGFPYKIVGYYGKSMRKRMDYCSALGVSAYSPSDAIFSHAAVQIVRRNKRAPFNSPVQQILVDLDSIVQTAEILSWPVINYSFLQFLKNELLEQKWDFAPIILVYQGNRDSLFNNNEHGFDIEWFKKILMQFDPVLFHGVSFESQRIFEPGHHNSSIPNEIRRYFSDDFSRMGQFMQWGISPGYSHRVDIKDLSDAERLLERCKKNQPETTLKISLDLDSTLMYLPETIREGALFNIYFQSMLLNPGMFKPLMQLKQKAFELGIQVEVIVITNRRLGDQNTATLLRKFNKWLKQAWPSAKPVGCDDRNGLYEVRDLWNEAKKVFLNEYPPVKFAIAGRILQANANDVLIHVDDNSAEVDGLRALEDHKAFGGRIATVFVDLGGKQFKAKLPGAVSTVEQYGSIKKELENKQELISKVAKCLKVGFKENSCPLTFGRYEHILTQQGVAHGYTQKTVSEVGNRDLLHDSSDDSLSEDGFFSSPVKPNQAVICTGRSPTPFSRETVIAEIYDSDDDDFVTTATVNVRRSQKQDKAPHTQHKDDDDFDLPPLASKPVSTSLIVNNNQKKPVASTTGIDQVSEGKKSMSSDDMRPLGLRKYPSSEKSNVGLGNRLFEKPKNTASTSIPGFQKANGTPAQSHQSLPSAQQRTRSQCGVRSSGMQGCSRGQVNPNLLSGQDPRRRPASGGVTQRPQNPFVNSAIWQRNTDQNGVVRRDQRPAGGLTSSQASVSSNTNRVSFYSSQSQTSGPNSEGSRVVSKPLWRRW